MENKLIIFVSLILFNILSVISVGLMLNQGLSCTVSSFMPGMHMLKGTCYPSIICHHKGGEAVGKCGFSEVCCIFPRTCGDVTAHNSTYFTNPGYPLPYNKTNTCLLKIHRIPAVNPICQLRLDFMDFELFEPNKGECNTDFFTVNGQNLNSVVPKICGYNSGQHLYVDIDGVQGPINLNMQTYGYGQRRWNILVSQIECNNLSKAPPNCLQYFLGANGEITSFNYNIRLHSNQMDPNSNSRVNGVGYINNLDYSICFRKEQYFCTQSYSVNTSNSVSTINDQAISIASSDWTHPGTAASGIVECPTDFILLNGIRFCGDRLNPRAVKQNNINYSEAVTDEGSGPFIVRFVSDDVWSQESSRGFKIAFKQNPCLLQFQNSKYLDSGHNQTTQTVSEFNKHEFNPQMCKTRV